MAIYTQKLLLPFVVAIFAIPSAPAADESAADDFEINDEIPLTEHDLEQITALVLAEHPLLASSPGIKWAGAWRSVRSIDGATVIYHPHAEYAGFKQAFEAHCDRQAPVRTWTCDYVKIRRYLQLENQDWEVRVTHEMDIDMALALIEATRTALHATATDISAIPGTVILIAGYGDGYRVAWGNEDGYGELGMAAYLGEDGDPAQPGDWQVSLIPPAN